MVGYYAMYTLKRNGEISKVVTSVMKFLISSSFFFSLLDLSDPTTLWFLLLCAAKVISAGCESWMAVRLNPNTKSKSLYKSSRGKEKKM